MRCGRLEPSRWGPLAASPDWRPRAGIRHRKRRLLAPSSHRIRSTPSLLARRASVQGHYLGVCKRRCGALPPFCRCDRRTSTCSDRPGFDSPGERTPPCTCPLRQPPQLRPSALGGRLNTPEGDLERPGVGPSCPVGCVRGWSQAAFSAIFLMGNRSPKRYKSEAAHWPSVPPAARHPPTAPGDPGGRGDHRLSAITCRKGRVPSLAGPLKNPFPSNRGLKKCQASPPRWCS